MNILQILPELNVGGVETGVLDLSGSIVKMGHRAVVVSNGGELVSELKKAGVKHYDLAVHEKNPVAILRNIKELIDIIKKENIDIVHARSRAPAWSAFFAARSTNTPFITTCHGYYSPHLFSNVMGWGKLVIVPSNIIGRHQMRDFGVPFSRIRHIPRSVNISRFKFKPLQNKSKVEFIVGIIGRITPLKGHAYFFKSMAKVMRKMPNVSIWVIGDAARGKERYKDEIDVLVKRLGLSSSVEFLGRQRDIPHILNQLDLLVVPTVGEEAFGRVIIEAQAAGVPVVASRVGGIVDIIDDGVNGVLVPARDVGAMSEAVVKILHDTTLAKKIVNAGRKSVMEKFTLDKMVSATLSVYNEAKNANILIIKFSALGDVILSTPAFRAIREKYPEAKITCLTSKESEEILSRCPYINELVICDFKSKDKGITGLFKLGKLLRNKCLDICIDLQSNLKSHVLAFLSLAPHRYGYNNKKFSRLLNKRVDLPAKVLAPVEHQSKILEMLDIDGYNKSLELWPSEADEKYIDGLLRTQWITKEQQLIGVNIASSLRWKTKMWPAKFVVKLSDLLMRKDIRMVLTGTEEDLELAREVFRLSKAKPIIACGKTSLNQLACLIKRCSVYVSADSAPLHIASAVNTPFVALFGPTDPGKHLPPMDKFVVISKNLECSPCYKPHCPDIKCMYQIAPEDVFKAIEGLLK